MQEKLQRRIASVEVKVLNPPRTGKRCLVLDIDYTLFGKQGMGEGLVGGWGSGLLWVQVLEGARMEKAC